LLFDSVNMHTNDRGGAACGRCVLLQKKIHHGGTESTEKKILAQRTRRLRRGRSGISRAGRAQLLTATKKRSGADAREDALRPQRNLRVLRAKKSSVISVPPC
jgi:hypothetical protein